LFRVSREMLRGDPQNRRYLDEVKVFRMMSSQSAMMKTRERRADVIALLLVSKRRRGHTYKRSARGEHEKGTDIPFGDVEDTLIRADPRPRSA